MLGQCVIATLALFATAGISASALRPEGPLEVVGDDIQHTVEASLHLLDDAGSLQDGISNTDDWRDFSGIPLTSVVLTNQDSRSIVLSSFLDTDRRDANSFYACSSDQKEKGAVFIFDVEDDGLVLQVVESRANFLAGTGMFLSANSLYSTDTIYPGFVRVMVHIDAKKAAVWKKVTVGGSQYLQIKINRDAGSQSTIGWYLAEPPNSVRDELTNYLAVTPDVSRAMPVSFKATE